MADRCFIVISGLGPDRTGLVADVTRFLTQRGANVEDSTAAVLGGEFGLMVLASGPEEAIHRVKDDLPTLEETTALTFLSRETVSPEEHRRTHAMPYRIEANALDHEGIVHAVTDALRQSGINIVSLQATARNAPVTGTPLFALSIRVDLPPEVAPEALRASLNQVAQLHNLDLEIRPDR